MRAAEDLALLSEAARAAGEIAMRHFRQDPQVWHKADEQGPVTEADLEVDEMLEARLRAARPDYGWMSEESADTPDRLRAERLFIVDPIDGTRAFISGNGAFSHALAVVERGAVAAGVVYLPAQDRLYAARAGGGATMNGAPIHCGRGDELGGARMLASRSTLDLRHWPGGVPEAKREHRPSLAYRLCLVAEGRFDAMVTMASAWEWDTAAGSLIAREAGALVTDANGVTPFYNSPRRRHAGVIAASPAIHALLMERRQIN